MLRNRSVRRARRGARLSVAIAAALSLLVVPAAALTIEAPSDFVGAGRVIVAPDPGEPSGTISLRDGAEAVATAETTGGPVVFEGVRLSAGPHSLSAGLTSALAGTLTAPALSVYSWGTPAKAAWKSPTAGTVASPVRVAVRAGASTATMTLSLNGRVVRAVRCVPGGTVDFGAVKLPKGASSLSVKSESLTGDTAVVSRALKRAEWPYATCIVIDKSEFRLYWIKSQQVVATYRVAHGRYNWTPCRTWKILAKYKTYAKGIYGPRKMRMFKRVGSRGHYRYVFTSYAIHGTNQPWVIGTMASHGCIRMYNSDILKLFPQVPIGTFVVTRP